MAEACACDLDAEHLGDVGDEQVACPLGHGWPAVGDRMLAVHGADERAPFGIGQADQYGVPTRMGYRRSPNLGHELLISQTIFVSPVLSIKKTVAVEAVGSVGNRASRSH
jgi:hypothetical protein